jgi:hypothetical protein
MSKKRGLFDDGPLPYKVFVDLVVAAGKEKHPSDLDPFIICWLLKRFGKSVRVVRYASRFNSIRLFVQKNMQELVKTGLVENRGKRILIATSLLRYLCKTPYSSSGKDMEKMPCGKIEYWRMKDILCQVPVPSKTVKMSAKRGASRG